MGIPNSIGKGIGMGIIDKLGRGYIVGIVVLIAFVVLLALGKETTQFTEFVTYFILPLIGVKEVGKIGTSWANRQKQPPVISDN